jgi:hypothetical protein
VARAASGIANRRACTECSQHLLGKRCEERAVEGLVREFLVDTLDVCVGHRVITDTNSRLVVPFAVPACYLRDVMRPWTARALAAGVDALCLGIFVALGRVSHDISSGIAWYFTVLWPFLVGWFVAALAFGVYKSPLDRWVMLACTWIVGCAIALGLRAAVTHRQTPIAFIIVTYIFIGLTTFGWRLFAFGLAWVRSREAIPPRLS